MGTYLESLRLSSNEALDVIDGDKRLIVETDSWDMEPRWSIGTPGMLKANKRRNKILADTFAYKRWITVLCCLTFGITVMIGTFNSSVTKMLQPAPWSSEAFFITGDVSWICFRLFLSHILSKGDSHFSTSPTTFGNVSIWCSLETNPLSSLDCFLLKRKWDGFPFFWKKSFLESESESESYVSVFYVFRYEWK